jgi:hypothetical protein
MEKIVIITKSQTFELKKHPKKGYVLNSETVSSKPKMHWMYLLIGGFIIGLLCSIFIGTLWILSFRARQKFIVDVSPKKFIQKCWGYW